MPTVKRILKGDKVKIISGANKGTTGTVLQVLTKQQAVLIEGVGELHRHIKPSQLNPRGGHKDIHVPVSLHKVALIVDEKSGKTSRVGRLKTVDNKTVRIAKQNNDKEIK